MKRVLFVCTGNICRSPTAEAFFSQLVRDAGRSDQIISDSCGIAGWHVGKGPDPRSVKALAKRGVDMSHLRARKISSDDYWQNDLLLAMDSTHLDHMRENAGSDASDMALFLSVLGHEADVPDPYYGDDNDFKIAVDLIEAGCRAWLQKIQAEL